MIRRFITEEESKDSDAWKEIIYIYPDTQAVDYYVHLPSPFFEDGYRDAIRKGLEERGWATGLMGLVSKDRIPCQEMLNCRVFSKAYREVFESLMVSDSITVPVKVAEFLTMVDTKAMFARLNPKLTPKELVWEDLESYLYGAGFHEIPTQQ